MNEIWVMKANGSQHLQIKVVVARRYLIGGMPIYKEVLSVFRNKTVNRRRHDMGAEQVIIAKS